MIRRRVVVLLRNPSEMSMSRFTWISFFFSVSLSCRFINLCRRSSRALLLLSEASAEIAGDFILDGFFFFRVALRACVRVLLREREA